MDLREYKHYKHQRHPWELSRYRFFEKILAREVFAQESLKKTVLDAGSGDMWFSSRLAHKFASIDQVYCWDESYSSEILEDLKPITNGSKLKPVTENPNCKADLILAMDVLEHVDDDKNFLSKLVNENLKEDGWILMSVPTWPNLFSNHDRAMKHHRRYKPAELTLMIQESNLKIHLSGGLFHSLLPVRYLQTKIQVPEENPLPDDTRIKLNGVTSRVMKAVFRIDNLLSFQAGRFGLTIPGLSCWALCTKQPPTT